MAPQLGHVSNFCRLKTGPLEPDQRADGIWDSGWENGWIQTGCPRRTCFEPWPPPSSEWPIRRP